MADRPILFSAPMVRALLDGRKTQTRRVAKFVVPDGDGWHIRNSGGGMIGADDDAVRTYGPDYAPYAPGDRLWVKETWQVSGLGWGQKKPQPGMGKLHYRATDEGEWQDYWGGWRSPLHMFRWASRITLTVTDVRVERLQDISEADAIAEGSFDLHGSNPVACYENIWNDINGPESWDANPWVAAISFDVRKGNIDG